MSSIQPGDVVQALPASRCPYFAEHGLDLPQDVGLTGKTYRVTDVVGPNDFAPAVPAWLILSGLEDEWCIGCFRKIDKADEEFTEQVRACRPIKQREPA